MIVVEPDSVAECSGKGLQNLSFLHEDNAGGFDNRNFSDAIVVEVAGRSMERNDFSVGYGHSKSVFRNNRIGVFRCDGRRRDFALVRWIVDFGIVAPIDIFRSSRAFLLFFQTLKVCQHLLGIGLASCNPVGIEKLESRGGEIRVEFCCLFEFDNRFGLFPLIFQKNADVVVRHRFVGNELGELLELFQRFCTFPLLFKLNAEIEIGVREFGIFLLDSLQLCDPFGGLSRSQESQPIVQFFSGRARRELHRFAELVDSLGLGGGVFVKGLTEIAVTLQTLCDGR